MGKLTVKELEPLSGEDNGKKLREDGGLIGIVRQGTGGISVYFNWRYRAEGKVKQTFVGAWPKMSLAAIRSKRDKFKHELANGSDPSERRKASRLKAKADQLDEIEKQKARLVEHETRQARQTVRNLFDRWFQVDVIRRKDKGAEVKRMFEKDVLPTLGTLAVEDVRKGDVTKVVDALLARNVPRMAKMIFSLMRQMFRFAAERDIIETDPTASIRKSKIGGPDTERERVLSEAEILLVDAPNSQRL
ncbi:MAG: integrase arm-type DNA-binding domain-containing protein [Betaproteobacteria bacterium]|nr:integrase arm-type DNA-binding domain-containing protein [Betaproteobacteria bacterium]